MKVFLAYKHQGEKPEYIKKLVSTISSAVEEAKHEPFCMFHKEEQIIKEKWTGKQIMDRAFKEIDKSNIILMFVHKKAPSPGMLVEAGYCIAKNKKIILFINKNVEVHILRKLVAKVVEWDTLGELSNKIKEVI